MATDPDRLTYNELVTAIDRSIAKSYEETSRGNDHRSTLHMMEALVHAVMAVERAVSASSATPRMIPPELLRPLLHSQPALDIPEDSAPFTFEPFIEDKSMDDYLDAQLQEAMKQGYVPPIRKGPGT